MQAGGFLVAKAFAAMTGAIVLDCWHSERVG
jgi:hypothetical protein